MAEHPNHLRGSEVKENGAQDDDLEAMLNTNSCTRDPLRFVETELSESSLWLHPLLGCEDNP
jgi:hypothetical protein